MLRLKKLDSPIYYSEKMCSLLANRTPNHTRRTYTLRSGIGVDKADKQYRRAILDFILFVDKSMENVLTNLVNSVCKAIIPNISYLCRLL